MEAGEAMYGLTAFVVGHFGDRAGIDNADVGHFALLRSSHSGPLKAVTKSGCLSEVELAAEGLIGCCFVS